MGPAPGYDGKADEKNGPGPGGPGCTGAPEGFLSHLIFWAYIAIIAFTIIVVPISVSLVSHRSVSLVGVYIGSTFIFQAGAVSLIGLSPNKMLDFAVVLSIGLGLIFTEFLILDTLAHRSPRVQGWIDKVEKKARKIQFIGKYGQYTLIPLMWIPGIGLYGGAIISWILEFDRSRSIVLLFVGWFVACSVVLSLVLGILTLL
jgi:uncharacterized membrane protein